MLICQYLSSQSSHIYMNMSLVAVELWQHPFNCTHIDHRLIRLLIYAASMKSLATRCRINDVGVSTGREECKFLFDYNLSKNFPMLLRHFSFLLFLFHFHSLRRSNEKKKRKVCFFLYIPSQRRRRVLYTQNTWLDKSDDGSWNGCGTHIWYYYLNWFVFGCQQVVFEALVGIGFNCWNLISRLIVDPCLAMEQHTKFSPILLEIYEMFLSHQFENFHENRSYGFHRHHFAKSKFY
jgi:hypothetical protein